MTLPISAVYLVCVMVNASRPLSQSLRPAAGANSAAPLSDSLSGFLATTVARFNIMSKSQIIAIIFDGNSENTFYAGQLVTGHVHVQTSERIKIRSIRLEVTGKAETSWIDGSVDEATAYTGSEEYMHMEVYFIDSRRNDNETYLEPSVYNYPFSFMLPPELPSSFDAIIGHIRYQAKAVIDRPMRTNDTAEVRFTVTVIRLLDLNQEPPQLREPQVIQIAKSPSGCFCIEGSAEINVTINRGCFVPGETIRIDGEIANRTNTNVRHLTITVVQDVEFCATYNKGKVYGTTHSSKILAKFGRPSVRRGHTDSWNNILFVVPQVNSSRLDGCGIINIRYYIEIVATFPGCCSKSSARSDIVIGNVPLQNDSQPSVVTSQPMGFPTPYNTAAGYMPPTNATTLGFDVAGVKAWSHDGKHLPQVESS